MIDIALVGAYGYGSIHLERILELHHRGRARLIGVADPAGVDGDIPAPAFVSLDALLDACAPDIVVISTPIHTHFALATLALRHGAHVLLEKPPVTSMAEFAQLDETVRSTRRSVQVAFQTLGSAGIDLVRELVADGAIGEPAGIGALGLWVRPSGYWSRSEWAGRRILDGVPVLDGAVANPLSHAVSTALAIACCEVPDDIAHVDLDLYRASPIECDDTSSLTITTREGRRLGFALVLTAERQLTPRVTVFGDQGQIDFSYEDDVVDVLPTGGPARTVRVTRTDLLENLIDHVVMGAALLSPLTRSGAFMSVLDNVRLSASPQQIDDRFIDWREEGEARHPVVDEVERWSRMAAEQQRTFRELGAPWARSLAGE